MGIFKKIFGVKEEPQRSAISFDALDSWLKDKEEDLNSRVSMESRPLHEEATATFREARKLIEKIYSNDPPSEAPRSLRGQIEKACRRFGKGAITIIEDTPTENPDTFKEMESFHSNLIEALSKIKSLSQIHGRLISASSPSLFRSLMGQLKRLSSQGERFDAIISSNKREYNTLREIQDSKADIEERIWHITKLKTNLVESEDLIKKAHKASKEIRVRLREIQKSEDYLGLMDKKRKLEDLEAKLEEGERAIYIELSPLARTLRKFRKHVDEGEYTLNRETMEALNEYISQPLEAFLAEKDGHPLLTDIALGAKTLLEKRILDIKTRRKEKIQKNLERVLRGELISIQRDHYKMKDEIASMKKEFSSSPLLHEMDKLRDDLQEKIELIDKYEREKKAKLEKESDLKKEICSIKKKLEDDMSKIEGRSIEVRMETY